MHTIEPAFADRTRHYGLMPLWVIENFFVPDISSWDKTIDYNHKSDILSSTHNRVELVPELSNDDLDKLNVQINQIKDYVIANATTQYQVENLWFDYLEKLIPMKRIIFLCDKPSWKMDKHLDNRIIAGVLIINLVDNPEETGTKFSPTFDEVTKYQAPTKKGSGIFFLNSHNMWHSIENNSDRNRYILYVSFIIPVEAI